MISLGFGEALSVEGAMLQVLGSADSTPSSGLSEPPVVVVLSTAWSLTV